MAVMRIAAVVIVGLASSAGRQQQHHSIWDQTTAAWQPAGKGFESSVVLGNPKEAGSYTLAYRLAPGAWIPPHTHPRAKQVTIISGALLMGFGTTLDSAAATPIKPGQIAVVPPNTAHFEGAKEPTVVLFSGDGPLVTNWVK